MPLAFVYKELKCLMFANYIQGASAPIVQFLCMCMNRLNKHGIKLLAQFVFCKISAISYIWRSFSNNMFIT